MNLEYSFNEASFRALLNRDLKLQIKDVDNWAINPLSTIYFIVKSLPFVRASLPISKLIFSFSMLETHIFMNLSGDSHAQHSIDIVEIQSISSVHDPEHT